MADPFLQDAVRRQSDRVFDPLTFEIFVDSEIGEARVSTEIEARDLAFVSRNDWLNTLSQPSALWTLPGRRAHLSRSPN